jgi:glycosyltransferase involved in cell wall biosynthesis
LSVFFNTPTLGRWQEAPASAGPPCASRPDQLTVAYLGLLEAPRGLGTAIQAMREVRRRMPGARLVVIGSGRDADTFREEARLAGVADAVDFLGWLDYPEALRRLQTCDVGLVPHHATTSWQTTIPNKLFDYMSLGKPVIVSDARPTKRIVTEEGCGLVFPDRDVRALAEAMVAMGDPALRDACGRRGQQAIAARYNWETDERRLLGAIRRVTDPTGSGREEPIGATPAPSGQGRAR